MHLTKTQLLDGLQCEKHLHLTLYQPEAAQPTTIPAAITGQVVEVHARLEFSDAVLIERGMPGTDPFQVTRVTMQTPTVSTLFEAAFQDAEAAVFVDVLQRARKGWDLIEIKAGTRIEDRHIEDVSIQVRVLTNAGIALNRIYLMHIDNTFVYPGDHDYAGLFVREDITERVRGHLATIEGDIKRLSQVAAGPEPVQHVGSHCKQPWTCEFLLYCRARDAKYPVSLLPRIRAQKVKELLANGVTDVRDIPASELTSETHQRIRRITIEGAAELLPGAAPELNALAWPRYYLDFECIQFAIPIWVDTRPYVQYPFQWSCHIEQQDGSIIIKGTSPNGATYTITHVRPNGDVSSEDTIDQTGGSGTCETGFHRDRHDFIAGQHLRLSEQLSARPVPCWPLPNR